MLKRLWLIACLTLPASAACAGGEFLVLCYHSVPERYDADPMAVSAVNFVAQLAWLTSQGYRAVSIDDLVAARDGRRPLPEKAFLITVDDGYENFYKNVFPILKLYRYPAVFALVGRWIENHGGSPLDDPYFRRQKFVTWAQVREMAASGLVEIASHSYDLHHGVPGNPQGNLEPASTTLRYDPATKSYETPQALRTRLRADLARNSALIARRTGKRPRVMVWPYGAYNVIGLEEARAAGMAINFSLTDGIARAGDLSVIPRNLIRNEPSLDTFTYAVRHRFVNADPVRAVHVDLDYVYDADPRQQEKNLSRLLDRVQALGVNTVYLQAFADPDGDGNVRELYFPNRVLPMRADLFNRVAWQLRSRVGVRVYAWMPVLAFELPDQGSNAKLAVRAAVSATGKGGEASYRRLSPFDPGARRLIRRIYRDLAAHAHFAGILYQDDAYLTDFEDLSPAARAAYSQALGGQFSLRRAHQDPAYMARWAAVKTGALIDFTAELTRSAAYFRPRLATARNLYAAAMLDPASETWLAQSYPAFLKAYDHVAVMAFPYLERAKDPIAWLRKLAAIAATHPQGLKKTVFELQALDWNDGNRPLPPAVLVEQMQTLQRLGANNLAYYPDDFIAGHPALAVVKRGISLQTNPFVKGIRQ
ncbi:MAG: poly-beta-1,6-N-acetyl-D-glucosamine N-deacetylase PgaB [Gammaproteobacteria bacterium]|nr:poly-beta-1,6-N-acetyl-D-glucosamine N-deacetylase PgaB [Gammaproteobacteria bacterium]